MRGFQGTKWSGMQGLRLPRLSGGPFASTPMGGGAGACCTQSIESSFLTLGGPASLTLPAEPTAAQTCGFRVPPLLRFSDTVATSPTWLLSLMSQERDETRSSAEPSAVEGSVLAGAGRGRGRGGRRTSERGEPPRGSVEKPLQVPPPVSEEGVQRLR